jgi:hypothetical protein
MIYRFETFISHKKVTWKRVAFSYNAGPARISHLGQFHTIQTMREDKLEDLFFDLDS